MTAAIQFGSRTIDFRLEYSDRKSLGITVTPEMEVLVKAPTDTSIERVNALNELVVTNAVVSDRGRIKKLDGIQLPF